MGLIEYYNGTLLRTISKQIKSSPISNMSFSWSFNTASVHFLIYLTSKFINLGNWDLIL